MATSQITQLTQEQIKQKLASLNTEMLSISARLIEIPFELQTAVDPITSDLESELLELTTRHETIRDEMKSLDPDGSLQKSSLNKVALQSGTISSPIKKSSDSLAFLEDKRRSNLNPIGFDVLKFANDMRSQIDSRRVLKASFSADLSNSFQESQVNAFYRMIGLPISGLKLSKEGTIKNDLSSTITARRSSSVNDLIDRDVPGSPKRFLYPVVDGAVPIPFSNRIRFPLINTVLSIRLNKYDFNAPDAPSKQRKGDTLQQIESILIKNIDNLIENSPQLLLKKIQEIDHLDISTNEQPNLGNDVNTLDAQKPNFTEADFDDTDPKKAKIIFSEIDKNQKAIKEELLVEKILLSLLPLQTIGSNELSGPIVGLMTNNRTFLNSQLASLVEKKERLTTQLREKQRALSAFNGVSIDTAASFVSDKNINKKNILINSIVIPEILAVISALFSLSEIDLLTLAINNGISSSFDLAGSLLSSAIAGPFTEEQLNEQLAAIKNDSTTLLASLSKLDASISEKLLKYNDVIKKSQPLIKVQAELKKSYKTLDDSLIKSETK